MNIQYRPVTESDKGLIRKLAKRNFGPLALLFFSLESGGWIAETADNIEDLSETVPVGAVILKKIPLKKEPLGLVSWIMSHPKARGMGVGSELMRLADQWFSDQGIRQSIAVIELYNQSSSKLFVSNGYRPLCLNEQIKKFGLQIIPVWIKSFFILSISHVLWYRDPVEKTDDQSSFFKTASQTTQVIPENVGFLKALGFHSLIFFIFMVRIRTPFSISEILLSSIAISLILLSFRTIPFWFFTHFSGLKTRYISWLGGSPLAVFVSAVFGAFIPYPGSLYPQVSQYSYKKLLPILGPASFMGAIGLLSLFTAVKLINPPLDLPDQFIMILKMMKYIIPVYIIIDILIPVFPFWGYLGRQIFLWKPWVWMMTAFTGILIIFIL